MRHPAQQRRLVASLAETGQQTLIILIQQGELYLVMDRLYVRGRENVHKKFRIQAAARNLALLMRSLYGSGKPRAAQDRVLGALLTI